MADSAVHQRIAALAAEEHRLLQAHHDGSGLTESERTRLREVEVALDQAWDLLRRREAAREAGLDTATLTERDPATVEGYLS
jgi:hypothetical protein